MSRLIASILLSILLFPLGALLYVLVFFVTMETDWFHGVIRDEMSFVVAGVVTWAFIGWYWIALWRKTVSWNDARRARTRNFATAAVIVGVVAGVAVGAMEREFGFFIASVTPPLLWMVATVLVWRETDAERTARLRATGRADGGIPCPTCAYDMTGLKGTRCPECGGEFTLDELVAGQPGHEATEIER